MIDLNQPTPTITMDGNVYKFVSKHESFPGHFNGKFGTAMHAIYSDGYIEWRISYNAGNFKDPSKSKNNIIK